MPYPVLSPGEIAQINLEKTKIQGQIDALNNAIPAGNARVAELDVLDGSFKKFFDYFNDDIITHYDEELRALNGTYIDEPIVEQDILDAANGIGRICPSLPATDIVRIPEFDGGNTLVDPLNEIQQFTNQDEYLDLLQNGSGAGGATVTATTLTTSVVTESSTSVDISDAVGPIAFAIGNKLILGGAIVEITSVVDNTAVPLTPPFLFTIGFDFILKGSASSGSVVTTDFFGFSDGQRTAKSGSPQEVMDNLVLKLQDSLNARLANLASQSAAITANEDDDHENKTTLQNNISASQSFINGYLPGTDISDIGIASLDNEKSIRLPQVTTRVSTVLAAYTGQTQNYYDQRYTFANDRANTQRGTLKQKQFELANIANIGDIIVDLQAQLDSYNNLVP